MDKRELKALEPATGSDDLPTETPAQYVARIIKILPNFPESVLIQWFYEHPQVIEDFSSLDYRAARFRLAPLSPGDLLLPCIAGNETVLQYRDHYLAGTESRRMQRIAECINATGTWPVPPIVLHNPQGSVPSRWGFNYKVPFDLLEGTHRMAVLFALQQHSARSHDVWLLSFDG